MKTPTVIVIRENLIESIVMDAVTFSCIAAVFALDHFYLGNRWYVAVFMLFMALSQVSAMKPQRRYYNIQHAIFYLRSISQGKKK